MVERLEEQHVPAAPADARVRSHERTVCGHPLADPSERVDLDLVAAVPGDLDAEETAHVAPYLVHAFPTYRRVLHTERTRARHSLERMQGEKRRRKHASGGPGVGAARVVVHRPQTPDRVGK